MGQTPSPDQDPCLSALRSQPANPFAGGSSNSPSAQPSLTVGVENLQSTCPDAPEERSGRNEAARNETIRAKEATETKQRKKDQQDSRN